MAEAVKTAEKTASERPVVVSAVGLTKVFRDFWNRPKAKAVNHGPTERPPSTKPSTLLACLRE